MKNILLLNTLERGINMRKYGFVYIWYDRKHRRFYIGCRWGNEDDGYICSSPWMKQAYKHRPRDFKRRILSKVYTNKKSLLEEEYKWLKLIRDDELGNRYYNLHNHHFNHWSANQSSRLTVGQKISKSHNRPETNKRLSDSKVGDNNPMKRQEVVNKRLETWKKGNHVPWNKGIKTGPNPEHSQRMKGRVAANKGVTRDDDYKKQMSEFNKARVWYVNRETNKCIHILANDPVPDGYVRGRSKRIKR